MLAGWGDVGFLDSRLRGNDGMVRGSDGGLFLN